MYHDIKQSYRGGLVDNYRPTNKNKLSVNAYDINSLYPTAMRNFEMPIGDPLYFESPGNFDKYKNEFGFFFVEIDAPDLYAPILQYRLSNSQGNPTGPSFCPTGT
jgi:hypothetical protein